MVFLTYYIYIYKTWSLCNKTRYKFCFYNEIFYFNAVIKMKVLRAFQNACKMIF